MNSAPIVAFTLALAATVPAYAQQRKPAADKPSTPSNVPRPPKAKAEAPKPKDTPDPVTSAAARSLFTLSDLDHGGTLDLKEATAAGLGPRECTAADFDADHKLSESEFLVAYFGNLTRLGRPVAADLTTEASKLAASLKKPEPPVVPQAPAQPPPANDAKSELERKIDEALRKSQQASTPVETSEHPARERRSQEADPPASGQGVDTKAAEAKTALNRRLRNAQVTPEEAAEQRQKLEQRIDNAQKAQEGKSGAASSETEEPGGGAKGEADRESSALEALEERLANTKASDEKAAAAREKLKKRIANAHTTPEDPLGGGASSEAAAPAPAPASAPAAGQGEGAKAGNEDERGAAAMEALEKRLANTGASEEQANAAREKLKQRIENAKQQPPPAPAGEETAPPAAPTEEDKFEQARKALERRIETTGLTEEQAAKARAKLDKRIQNAQKPKPAEEGSGEPAAAPGEPERHVTPEEFAKVAREALDKRLQENHATPEEVAKAHERFEKRLSNAEARQTAGKNEPEAKPPAPAPQPSDPAAKTPAPATGAPAAKTPERKTEDPAAKQHRPKSGDGAGKRKGQGAKQGDGGGEKRSGG